MIGLPVWYRTHVDYDSISLDIYYIYLSERTYPGLILRMWQWRPSNCAGYLLACNRAEWRFQEGSDFSNFFLPYLLCFHPAPGAQPTPTQKPHPYIHRQFIALLIFSALQQPIHLLSLTLHDQDTSTFSLLSANYLH